ncbi:MAG: tetratricopeptide repeat protein [Xanthomonadales bacterium]|nr:tetratricopeptide repeat protein [Xanthomonadales bacterium]
MPVILTYLIQILLIVHVLKTGRNRIWIWVLIMLPGLGGLAYVLVEVLPELTGGIRGQRAMRTMKKALDPGAELRDAEAAWEQSPNADNARRLAAALIEAEQYPRAHEVLDQALSGFFSTEPSLLLLKARTLFEEGRPDDAVATLETLTSENPDFRSAEGHLLQARSLEASGRLKEAIEEYRAVSHYFPGAEARLRLARALEADGQVAEARDELERMLNDARLAPAHFRKAQKPWLDEARASLTRLQN